MQTRSAAVKSKEVRERRRELKKAEKEKEWN